MISNEDLGRLWAAVRELAGDAAALDEEIFRKGGTDRIRLINLSVGIRFNTSRILIALGDAEEKQVLRIKNRAMLRKYGLPEEFAD